MLEFLKKVWSQVQEAAGSLPPSKRVAIGAVGLIVMMGILGVAYLSGKPDYHPLFTKLTPGDTSAITQLLTEEGVEYKLSQDGAAVLVPADKVHQMRLKLATAGLPTGGVVGFEIFDEGTFGMTEFVQKLNFRRALEGELARTISQFREIQSCRVHIAKPERKLFTRGEQEGATASVVLKVAYGNRLGKEKVRGIAHLVAAGVDGLEPDKVTIVDVNGNVLFGGEPHDEVALLSATQLEYRGSVEREMEQRITSMLESMVGTGKVVTRVNAEIDFRRVERTEKKFDPESQVIRSEQRSESKSTGAESPYGAAGVASNLPGGQAAAATAGKPATSSETQETINYEINEVVSHMVEPVGTVKKMSIAVMVDGEYETEDGERVYTPRSEEDIQRLTNIVRTAAGFDADRGDVVTVMSAPFETAPYMAGAEEVEAAARWELYAMIARYIGMVVLAAALFLFVIRPLINWITASSAEVEALRRFPATIEQMEASMGVARGEEEVDYRSRINQLIQENPKGVAEMIREWLRSRR
ncbi:MAG: flagellar basal-body MS-ring/collar protein FliF [Candidatus Nitrospinota bacterium M3_3B_026]